MLSRRSFLGFGAALAAGTTLVSPAEAALRTRMERSVHFYNIHTGEDLRTVYWLNGHYQPGALQQISHILRDHCNGAVHPIDPKMVDLVCALGHKLGNRKPFHVVCGYRSAQTNARMAANSDGVASHSLHMEGKAVDLRLEDVEVSHLGRAAKSLRLGGVGLYPASDFVHVDVGKVRYW